MLKMRLQRIGRKNNPSYRVLVVDSHQGPKSGKYVDIIGSYDPKNDHIVLDGEKARAWIGKGVQVSPTVHNLLISQKVIEGKKINVLPRKSPIQKEGAGDAAASAPAVDVSESTPDASAVAPQVPETEEQVTEDTTTPTEEVPTDVPTSEVTTKETPVATAAVE